MVLHSLAIVATALNTLPLTIKLLIALAVIISLWQTLQQHYFTTNRPTLRYSHATGWEIMETQQITPIKILSSTVSIPYMTFLHYQKADKPQQNLLIFKDALSHEQYRQLSVCLKISAHL